MKEIVGLIGVIGSGKTYQRDLLIKKKFKPVDFKDALIKMVEDLVGYPIRDNYELFKQTVVGFTAPNMRMQYSDAWLLAKTAEIEKDFPEIMTGRRMLQRVGTEVMRKRDANYWVNEWAKTALGHLNKGHSVVIADVRFDNEIKKIRALAKEKKIKSRIIFCNYKSDRYNATSLHESERLAQSYIGVYADGAEIMNDLEQTQRKKKRQ